MYLIGSFTLNHLTDGKKQRSVGKYFFSLTEIKVNMTKFNLKRETVVIVLLYYMLLDGHFFLSSHGITRCLFNNRTNFILCLILYQMTNSTFLEKEKGGANSLGRLIYQIKNSKTLNHVFLALYAFKTVVFNLWGAAPIGCQITLSQRSERTCRGKKKVGKI